MKTAPPGRVAQCRVGTRQDGRLDREGRGEMHRFVANERLVLGQVGRIRDESSVASTIASPSTSAARPSTTTSATGANTSALSQISSPVTPQTA